MEVFIEEGMYVKKGQILAQLDDSSAVAGLIIPFRSWTKQKRFERTKRTDSRSISKSSSSGCCENNFKGLEALTD